MTFIPSFLWDRKTKLLENCKQQQQKDQNLRYQIRLGRKDIELWTKYQGEKYFRKTPILAFGDLPEIEDDTFSPIKERSVQSIKRPRSQSPSVRNTHPRTSSLEEDRDEERMLAAAMEQQELQL